jgi:hypothetical protein
MVLLSRSTVYSLGMWNSAFHTVETLVEHTTGNRLLGEWWIRSEIVMIPTLWKGFPESRTTTVPLLPCILERVDTLYEAGTGIGERQLL